MAKKLFVGNLSWKMTNEDLYSVFAEFGEIEEAVVAIDKLSGRSKGFGFVTYVEDASAASAIEALNGAEIEGRQIAVNEALPPKPREERRSFRNDRY